MVNKTIAFPIEICAKYNEFILINGKVQEKKLEFQKLAYKKKGYKVKIQIKNLNIDKEIPKY